VSLTISTIKTERKDNKFDLFKTITCSISKNKDVIQDGDVLVISSKYVSIAQGRILSQNSIKSSKLGINLSKKFQMKENIAEVVTRESDKIFGGIPGFVISVSDNILAPNAGIDKSNAKKGMLILYPEGPYLIAEELRRQFFLKFSIHIGVIIVDSRLMPARVGTIGIAIACAGIEPVADMRAKKDLDDNPLKVTFKAVVDNLASMANHSMGEGSESKPIAIIRNSGAKLTDRKINPNEMTVDFDQCVYIRGLKRLE